MAWTVISPATSDTISDSLANIRGNFVVLAAAWDGDHETLTGSGTSSTKHNRVTTPDQAGHVSTGADEPKLYATATTANLGVLQFSRAGSDSTPTPLTGLHSTAAVNMAGGATTPVLDFAGLNRCVGTVLAWDEAAAPVGLRASGLNHFYWTGADLYVQATAQNGYLGLSVSGTTLSVINNSILSAAATEVWWSLNLHRYDA